MTSPRILASLRKTIWQGRVPLEIRLASEDCKTYDQSDAYLILAPRISYLPLLVPRLAAFFHSNLIDENLHLSDAWFSFEDVPLKWHHPIGLLFDLYSRSKEQLVEDTIGKASQDDSPTVEEPLPWRLTVHFSRWPLDQLVKLDTGSKVLQDAFNNSVKEASYIRHGSGKVIMALGKEPTEQLWEAVQNVDVDLYASANTQLIRRKADQIKNLPIKIYLPAPGLDDSQGNPQPGHLRLVQGLITPTLANRQPQTLGTALNTLIPALFPSRRSPLLAYPILHGAIVPLSTEMEELAEFAAYADGFLHIVIAMMA